VASVLRGGYAALRSILNGYSSRHTLPAGQHRVFAPFRLNPLNEQFWRDEQENSLGRKTFEMMRHL